MSDQEQFAALMAEGRRIGAQLDAAGEGLLHVAIANRRRAARLERDFLGDEAAARHHDREGDRLVALLAVQSARRAAEFGLAPYPGE